MTVLLDTNVVMDALQERKPFDVNAKTILMCSQNGDFDCLFTANAAADIFYLYSKARDTKSAKTVLEFLLKHYGVISVTQEDCLNALTLPIDDFEDALVVCCAKKAKVDYIVTRDVEMLNLNLLTRVISPSAFLEQRNIV